MTTQTIGERNYKAGYVVRTETHQHGSGDFEMKTAYTPDGDYIGDPKRAYRLCKTRGIKPEKSSPDHCVCSIGFSDTEQKWYGWSHRAIFGFGIGSKTKKGDCAYMPANKQDFIEDCIRFWDDKHHVSTTGADAIEDGMHGVQVNWLYDDKVRNEKIRGTIGGIFTPYPDSYGRGDWTAATLADARQMAVDFAESVS